MRSRGFGREMATAHAELFVDGEPQTVARWPNADADDPFARIAGYPAGKGRDDGHGTDLGILKENNDLKGAITGLF